jgi:RNA polymerase-associated protein CTR9
MVSGEETSLAKATEVFNDLDKNYSRHILTLVGKGTLSISAAILTLQGWLLIAAKQYTQAESHLSVVVAQNPNNIPARLALAKVVGLKGDYKKALSLYQRAFQLNPNYSPDLRVPIGLCFYKLDMMQHAKRAFEKAYERVRLSSSFLPV